MHATTKLFTGVLFAACLAGCTGSESSSQGSTSTADSRVSIDGSSTVFPITEAVAVEFRSVRPEIRVTVGVSGTGGGFKKFCIGETDLNDASRPIKEKEESIATASGIGFIELPIAFDGISVVVNKKNAFVDHLTVLELREIWSRDGKFRKWSDVRSNWPDRQIVLYGPGTASGTFDYFVEAVLGKGGECRPDFAASEDDNVIVTGVSGDEDGFGFFGFAYYQENKERLRVVPIAAEAGLAPVTPSIETINNGTYTPLSRPIFIYVSDIAAKRDAVRSFVHFYLDNAANLSREVGYVPLPAPVYSSARERFDGGVTGTIFRTAKAGTDIEALMRRAAQGAN